MYISIFPPGLPFVVTAFCSEAKKLWAGEVIEI